VLVVLLALVLTPDAPCLGPAVARADVFDLPGAVEELRAAAQSCDDAVVAAQYLEGLTAARRAYASGGSPESLQPVKDSIAALDRLAAGLPGRAQIAALVLHAAAAAAQSERDDMALYLDEALRRESLQLTATQPAAPIISAHEAAGDLWLEVHQFDDARRAYERAAAKVGSNPRIVLGRARTAARVNDASACSHYRQLLDDWGARTEARPEISEARDYVRQMCAQPGVP